MMIKFLCNKLGRDKGLEGFAAQAITPHYKILIGKDLCNALKNKLLEEAYETQEANEQEITAELADVLEVIHGLCRAYGISVQKVEQIREQKYQERGGFEKGLYIETLEMETTNPKVEHFRKSPLKYPEI